MNGPAAEEVGHVDEYTSGSHLGVVQGELGDNDDFMTTNDGSGWGQGRSQLRRVSKKRNEPETNRLLSVLSGMAYVRSLVLCYQEGKPK